MTDQQDKDNRSDDNDGKNKDAASRLTKRQWTWLAVGLVSLSAMAAAIAWYLLQDKPQPRFAQAVVTPPGISPVVNEEIRPEPARLRFQLEPPVPGRKYIAVPEGQDSLARIDLLDKRVNNLVTVTPFHPGDWKWSDERTLTFTPAADWPAGETFRVRLSPKLFAPHIALQDYDLELVTPPFSGRVTNFRFHQDPVQHDVRRAVGTLEFTHPVDPAELEEHISLGMRPDGATVETDPEPVGFSVEYSPARREAYVHSDPIELPDTQNYIRIEVDAELTAEKGPSELGAPLEAQAIVPDVASFFRVEDIGVQIIRNEDGEPEQALLMDFTDRVDTELFQQRVSIWLLPQDHTVGNRRHTRYNWRSPREVTPDVLARAEQLEIIPNPTEDRYSDVQSFRLDAPENRQIYIKVAGGLESENGFVMRKPYDNVQRLPRYPREVKVAREGAVLPLTGNRDITFVSRGVAALKVEIGRVVPGQVNHLVSQTHGDMSSPVFSNYRFDEDNITERFETVLPLNAEHPKKATYSHLDLDRYIPSDMNRGMFFVNVRGWDPDSKRYDGGSDRRFVLITDLGLLSKRNLDGSHEFFVQSLQSGQPVADAEIELLGVNGIPVLQARTDAQGHAHIADASGFQREKQPSVFVVRHRRDLSFMPYDASSRQLQLSRFDIGGEYTSSNQDAAERMRAFMFSDRGIYRPGDKVHLSGIVARDDWGQLTGVPLEMEVRDPRGNRVLARTVTLPADGMFTEEMETGYASATGEYHAQVYLLNERGRRSRQLGSVGFKVEEFQPDTMRIRATLPAAVGKAWLKPGDIKAEVKLENLFGMPAQDRRIEAEYELRPTALHFGNFSRYRFEDPLRTTSSELKGARQRLSARSGDDGMAELTLRLGDYAGGIYRLQMDVEGYEQGDGRSVRANASAMISPLDFVVGWKADGELRWLQRDSERNIEYIVLGQDGKPQSQEDMRLRLKERRYVSTLVQQRDRTYAYQSTLKTRVVNEEPLAISAKGASTTLPTTEPGEYELEVVGPDGLVLASTRFTVVGEANLAGKQEKNSELDLKLEKADYASGEEISMQVTAPYAGTGLITIERDKVYAWKWFSTDAATSVQKIRVPEGLEGNAYVHVAFVRDIASPEVFVSPLSYAVAPFAVDRGARTVELDIETAEKVIPGEKLEIHYSASKPSRIALFAVDEGILQVAKYRTPDPLSFFFRKKALQVSTHQILDLIMPEYELIRRAAAAGGGEDAASALGANLNPFRRKTEAPVVFWAGLVEAGPETRTIDYDVPDYFNGRLRIMAVAAGDGAVGSAENATIVRGPFVLTPNVLTAAAPGDEFDVTVGVANALEGSGPDAKVSVTVEPSANLEILGESGSTLSISEGSEDRVRFRVRAKDAPGNASLSFTANSETGDGKTSVSRKATLSIRPAVAFETTTQAGVAEGSQGELSLARQLRPEFAEQRAAASASPLVLADGMTSYLDHFPHGCAEQIVSRAFPWLGLSQAELLPIEPGKARAAFDRTVQQLRPRQNADGGFRFWPSPMASAHFPTIYVAHYLTDAREQGLPVPDDMLSSVLDFTRRMAEKPVESLHEARLRAYAIYVLTRNGIVTTNLITNLHESLDRQHKDVWKQDLAAAYMAATYEMLKHADLAQQLLGDYELTPNQGEWFSDFDTRLGRDAQYVYLLSRHFPQHARELSGNSLQALTNPIFEGNYNTLSASYAVIGLSSYTALQSENQSLGSVGISAAGADGKPVPVEGDAAVVARAVLPIAARNVAFDNASAERSFYIVSQAGYDSAVPNSSVSEGMEIQREYLGDNDRPVTSANIGDELTVRLRVRSTGGYRSNVALVDLLPGGFEVLRDSVRDGSDAWRPDYRDIREDRVVIYGGFGSSITEIRYRVKMTASGNFIIPPATAKAMYDRTVRARSAGGRFEVGRPE